MVPRLRSFAPWYYFAKVWFLLGSAVAIEAYMHANAAYSWRLSALLGLIFALIGKFLSTFVFMMFYKIGNFPIKV